MKQIESIFFSPTSTGKHIIRKITEQFGLPIHEDDISKKPLETTSIPSNTLTFVVVPTYGGRIPLIALDRLKSLKGNGGWAIPINIYGNINVGDVLLELSDFLKEHNFKIAAGASFIGEHSFSTEAMPIAPARPDNSDDTKAAEFGQKLKELFLSNSVKDVSELIPGNYPYKERGEAGKPVAPIVDTEKCNQCGICITVCPTQAIYKEDDKIKVHAEDCIHCCACVKACPQGARSFTMSKIKVIYERGKERQEPKCYL